MLFPTVDFALFFCVVFAATWLFNPNNNLKKWFLVGASYFFYAFWDASYVLVLFSLSIWNFVLALLFDRERNQWRSVVVLWVGVSTNIAVLAFFKYANFLVAATTNTLAIAGVRIAPQFVELAVPVAISFVVFHCIAYIVDVYRRTIEPSKSFVDLLLYLSFFPHLVAGPIVRPASFLNQTARASNPLDIDVGRNAFLILGGLFKKVVIASHLATGLVEPAFRAPESFSSLELLIALYAYALQIYCDFSAYTDIAIGVANLLGYRFPQNFNQPYRAISLQDFWRRWHITLSNWLRDYLYIPLGGNRFGERRTYLNIMITMTLGWLWHGASFNFVIWGLMHGTWLVEPVPEFCTGR